MRDMKFLQYCYKRFVINQTDIVTKSQFSSILKRFEKAYDMSAWKDAQVLLSQFLWMAHYSDPESAYSIQASKFFMGTTEIDWRDLGIRAIDVENGWSLSADPYIETIEQEWFGGKIFRPSQELKSRYPDFKLEQEESFQLDAPVRDVMDGDYKFYRCVGQRDLVHTAFLTKPDHTAILSLPTGMGKTLAFESLAKVWASTGRTMIVVVPTVSLAKDMERRFKQGFCAHDIAYVGSLTSEQKKNIRIRIRQGTQKVVITSPEVLFVPSMMHAVLYASEKDRLTAFVIDEAHMVSQWGAFFRPKFQTLSAVHRKLVEVSTGRGFPTLLFTATLSEQSFFDLRTLFPSYERTRTEITPKSQVLSINVVSAAHLRPEIDYYGQLCTSQAEQITRLEKLLPLVPKPCIVYTTMKNENEYRNVWSATELESKIKEMGYERVSRYDGSISQDKTLQIKRLEEWQDRKIDIMVATSAFGVGIDQSDVRTVIHMCVPESLDRFYQEVGRGGRDGCPSTSVILWTQEDKEVAKGMAAEKVLTSEKAWERWSIMRGRDWCKQLTVDRFEVDLQARDSLRHNAGDYNLKWNETLLNTLNRFGWVRLHISGTHNDNKECIVVEYHDLKYQDYLKDRETFIEKFEVARAKFLELSQKARDAMFKFLDTLVVDTLEVSVPDTPIDILADFYFVQDSGVRLEMTIDNVEVSYQQNFKPSAVGLRSFSRKTDALYRRQLVGTHSVSKEGPSVYTILDSGPMAWRRVYKFLRMHLSSRDSNFVRFEGVNILLSYFDDVINRDVLESLYTLSTVKFGPVCYKSVLRGRTNAVFTIRFVKQLPSSNIDMDSIYILFTNTTIPRDLYKYEGRL